MNSGEDTKLKLKIHYRSENFSPLLGIKRSDFLEVSWDDLIWAALTVGRPNLFSVFAFGPSSLHEAVFRLSLVRLAVSGNLADNLQKTEVFQNLDPTEKGMVSYFLGLVLCKLFADKLLHAPWCLHVDVFRDQIQAQIKGRSRPDLVAEDIIGKWHVFECKGRSSKPSELDMMKAKTQAGRLTYVGDQECQTHIGSFVYFDKGILNFFWRDPDGDETNKFFIPEPDEHWRYYFEPILSIIEAKNDDFLSHLTSDIDIDVSIHPEIANFLRNGHWKGAHDAAKQMNRQMIEGGYHYDGIRVTAGDSWLKLNTSLEI